MAKWTLNLVAALLMPAFMIIYGNIYRSKAPEDINGSNGYKTARSRLNRDTWEFANCYYNKLMRVAGWILLPLSTGAMLFIRGKSDDLVKNSGMYLLVVQVIVMLVGVIPTERLLRKTFDENGRRR